MNYLGSENHNSAASLSGKGTEKLPKLPNCGLFANGFPKLKSPSLKANSGKDFFSHKISSELFRIIFLMQYTKMILNFLKLQSTSEQRGLYF